jgi:hypothetical protein
VSYYPTGEDKAAAWWWMVLLIAAMVFLTCVGCTEARCPEPAPPDPINTFGDIGVTLAWAGGISAAAGLAFSLISLFYPPLQPFAVLFRYAAIGGAGVSATGAAYIWIAAHFWWILALAALVGCGVAWWCWPRIHKLLDRRLSGKI